MKVWIVMKEYTHSTDSIISVETSEGAAQALVEKLEKAGAPCTVGIVSAEVSSGDSQQKGSK